MVRVATKLHQVLCAVSDITASLKVYAFDCPWPLWSPVVFFITVFFLIRNVSCQVGDDDGYM